MSASLVGSEMCIRDSLLPPAGFMGGATGGALTRSARRRLLRRRAWDWAAWSPGPPPGARAAADAAARAFFAHQAALWQLAARALDAYRGEGAGVPAPTPPPGPPSRGGPASAGVPAGAAPGAGIGGALGRGEPFCDPSPGG
eukprot:14300883-Alexandrium_andersonii.AAC.1